MTEHYIVQGPAIQRCQGSRGPWRDECRWAKAHGAYGQMKRKVAKALGAYGQMNDAGPRLTAPTARCIETRHQCRLRIHSKISKTLQQKTLGGHSSAHLVADRRHQTEDRSERALAGKLAWGRPGTLASNNIPVILSSLSAIEASIAAI